MSLRRQPLNKLERCPLSRMKLLVHSKKQFFTTLLPTCCLEIVDASAFFHTNEGNVPLHGINDLASREGFSWEEMAETKNVADTIREDADIKGVKVPVKPKEASEAEKLNETSETEKPKKASS